MVDRATQEAYEEYSQEKKSPQKKISKAFTTKQLIVIAVVGVIGFYLFFVKKVFSTTEGWMFIILGAIIIWLILNKESESKIISMKEAMAIVSKELEYMQTHTNQIPQGTIYLPPIAKLKSLDGQFVKWRVAAEIETQHYQHRMYIAEVHPYEGFIMGIYETPRGFGDIDKPDVKWIPTKEMVWDKKYNLHYGDNDGRRKDSGTGQ